MMKRIDSQTMRKFIRESLLKLEGDWVIIGGSLLPLLGIDHRVTVDIDMISIQKNNSNAQSIKLMEIAENLGFPVETINQAGAYFLSKIPQYQKHLILFQVSKKCRIFRPDVYLFLKLKISRMSQSDLDDCLAFVKKNRKEFEDQKKLIFPLLKKSLGHSSLEANGRIRALLDALRKLPPKIAGIETVE